MYVAVADMRVMDLLTADRLQSAQAMLQQCAMIILDTNLASNALAWLTSNFPDKPIFTDTVSSSKAARLAPHLASIHTLKTSTVEAQSLTGIAADSPVQLHKIADRIHAQGVERVFITRGKQQSGALACWALECY